eukprot:505060-Amphidinium_carterae.1
MAEEKIVSEVRHPSFACQSTIGGGHDPSITEFFTDELLVGRVIPMSSPVVPSEKAEAGQSISSVTSTE